MRRWRTNVLLFSNDITILYRSLFPSSVCITFLLTCIMLHDFNKGAKIMEILSGRAFIYFALIKFSIYFPIKEKFFRILISRGTGFGSHTLHVCYYLKHVIESYLYWYETLLKDKFQPLLSWSSSSWNILYLAEFSWGRTFC